MGLRRWRATREGRQARAGDEESEAYDEDDDEDHEYDDGEDEDDELPWWAGKWDSTAFDLAAANRALSHVPLGGVVPPRP